MHTQPVEDIDAVIGRFQAWAGSRNNAEPKPGIRELTYEEALEWRRRRWKGATPASVSKAPQNDLREQSDVELADTPRRASAKSAPRRKAGTQKSGNEKRKTSTKPLAPPAKKATIVAKTETSAPAHPPAFREVLASAVRPAEVVVAAQSAELARQVAISIRLAPSERAVLRTRAAEAGVTVSAYVRQCALEVEQLRAQVKQTLAALEKQAVNPAVAFESPRASRPGLLIRLMRRLLPAPTSTLTLRA